MFHVAFGPDGRRVLAWGSDDVARVFDIVKEKREISFTQPDSVFDVSISPDNRWIATGSFDHTMRVWEAATAKPVSISYQSKSVFKAVFSPDGRYVLTAGDDHSARLIEAATGKEILLLRTRVKWYRSPFVAMADCWRPAASIARRACSIDLGKGSLDVDLKEYFRGGGSVKPGRTLPGNWGTATAKRASLIRQTGTRQRF